MIKGKSHDRALTSDCSWGKRCLVQEECMQCDCVQNLKSSWGVELQVKSCTRLVWTNDIMKLCDFYYCRIRKLSYFLALTMILEETSSDHSQWSWTLAKSYRVKKNRMNNPFGVATKECLYTTFFCWLLTWQYVCFSYYSLLSIIFHCCCKDKPVPLIRLNAFGGTISQPLSMK